MMPKLRLSLQEMIVLINHQVIGSRISSEDYPLVNVYSLLLNMAQSRVREFSHTKMVIFHSHKRVPGQCLDGTGLQRRAISACHFFRGYNWRDVHNDLEAGGTDPFIWGASQVSCQHLFKSKIMEEHMVKGQISLDAYRRQMFIYSQYSAVNL